MSSSNRDSKHACCPVSVQAMPLKAGPREGTRHDTCSNLSVYSAVYIDLDLGLWFSFEYTTRIFLAIDVIETLSGEL